MLAGIYSCETAMFLSWSIKRSVQHLAAILELTFESRLASIPVDTADATDA
jgi:hypothetical protein